MVVQDSVAMPGEVLPDNRMKKVKVLERKLNKCVMLLREILELLMHQLYELEQTNLKRLRLRK